MKYFLLQTSCEYKSPSSPELPQYLSTAKSPSIQKYLHMCWHRRTTIQRSDDSNMSQIAPSVIYRSHAWLLCSLICIWVPEVSPSHRKQLIVWVCAAYTNWGERVHVTLAMHVSSMDTDRNETAGNQCVWSMWYCYCPLGHGHSPALSSYPWKRHQASVLLVTDSKTKSNRRDLVRFEFYSFSETCSYIRTCFYLKWLRKEEQNQFVTEPTIFVLCIARCIWQLD